MLTGLLVAIVTNDRTLKTGAMSLAVWLAMLALMAFQVSSGIIAFVFALRAHKLEASRSNTAAAVLGALLVVWTPMVKLITIIGIIGMGASHGFGGAWGRPLRVRGRQLHPTLTAGSNWTRGARPDPSGLDEATRRALEALWLHDAQKEHASVPAFSRVSWLLAAAGAPAELLEGAHRAALEEIEHTRLCFALAAGYSGRSFSVEPMPDLVVGGMDVRGDPRVLLAVESLKDGCLLEDFNADVAAACAQVCSEPVTRGVLELIAREERSHADFSWAVVEFLLHRDRQVVDGPLRRALTELEAYPRPTAVSRAALKLVANADVNALRAHGRLGDDEWATLWGRRLGETRTRMRASLDHEATRHAA